MAVPETMVTAAETAKFLNISEHWITEQAGIQSRFHVRHESGASLGAAALRQAMASADCSLSEIDLLICAGATYDQPVPSNASLLLHHIGAPKPCPAAWDVDATCLSFIAALEIADAFIAQGRYRRIAIVSTEIASKSLNRLEQESAVLFGDASAAVIIERAGDEDPSSLLAFRMETYPEGAPLAAVRGGGNAIPAGRLAEQPEAFAFAMNGRELMRLTLNTLRPFMERLFHGLPFGWAELECLIPHQASRLGLALAEKILGVAEGFCYRSLERYGNCVAASIPLSLHLAIEEGALKRGDRLCLAGTGAGFALGGAVLIY